MLAVAAAEVGPCEGFAANSAVEAVIKHRSKKRPARACMHVRTTVQAKHVMCCMSVVSAART